MPKSSILVSSDHNTFTQFSSESLANFRRAGTCVFLSRGTLQALQDFSPSRRSMLPIVFLVTMVPAALRLTRSLTRSSRVVLGWFLTVLMIIETPRGEILHGAPVIDSYFVFLPFPFPFSRHFYPKRLTEDSGYTFFYQYVCSLGIEPMTFCTANAMLYHWATGTPFANNRTNCCHLLTKLLCDCLVAHSSLVLVYNLVPDNLGQLFGLGHGGEFGIWLIASVDRCLLYR